MSAHPAYFDLRIGAPRRLAALKAKGEDWRHARGWGFHNWESAHGVLSCGSNEGRPIWYSQNGEYLRDERFADQFTNDYGCSIIDHNGWFTDGEMQSETARGIVGRLPHGRFMAGYYLSMNDERVYFPEVFDDARDAARMADEHARVIGEQESEYAERWQAARDLEDKIERAENRLRECVLMRNTPGFDYARDEARRLIARIRKDRETLSTDYAEVQ